MFRARNGWRDLLKKHSNDICQELKSSELENGSHSIEPN